VKRIEETCLPHTVGLKDHAELDRKPALRDQFRKLHLQRTKSFLGLRFF